MHCLPCILAIHSSCSRCCYALQIQFIRRVNCLYLVLYEIKYLYVVLLCVLCVAAVLACVAYPIHIMNIKTESTNVENLIIPSVLFSSYFSRPSRTKHRYLLYGFISKLDGFHRPPTPPPLIYVYNYYLYCFHHQLHITLLFIPEKIAY